jgi:hypothetical protein
MYALEVDIDNKDPKKITTISEFEERFKEYTYFLYTTSSYIKNEIDKFRVIIPLEQRIKWNVFYNSKEELGVYFNTADNSSWTNFHNLPNIVPGKTDYYYKINYGKFWNFVSELLPIRSEILMKRQQEKPQIVVEYTNMPNEDYKKQQLEKILKKLNDIPSDTCGDRYTRLVSVTCRMILVKHNGEYIFSDHEIEQTILSHTDDARVRAMLKSNLKQDRDTLKHKVGK